MRKEAVRAQEAGEELPEAQPGYHAAFAANAPRAPVHALLRPGSTVWRTARAHRASVLVDAAGYYAALRSAMLAARSSIDIVGWDLDSRTPLVGESGRPDDDLPVTLAAFLSALVRRNPALRVRLLLWDYSLIYALERELAPFYSFNWRTPKQIEICLDDSAPLGGSQHQKLVVIDNRIAFCGGLDITSRRWDTPHHKPDDPRRTDPRGASYPPFHDLQMMVDGPAAAALGDLVRQRWRWAACEQLKPPAGAGAAADGWPAAVTPDFLDVDIGISRTVPEADTAPAIREVEALHLALIGAAERHIYIENQFLTAAGVAEALAARMRKCPGLELVMVAPRRYPGWVESQAMQGGRARFMQVLDAAGVMERVRLVCPVVSGADGSQTDIFVHSKLMIVDDLALRVGSANLANRSMTIDSECDLTVIAANETQRAGVAAVRARLLGEHLGLAAEDVERRLSQPDASLLALIDASSAAAGARRVLQPVDPQLADETLEGIGALADPQPSDGLSASGDKAPRKRWRGWMKAALALGVLVVMGLAWQYSPFVEPQKLAHFLGQMADRPWAPALVLVIFILGDLVLFPVNLLILGTITVFGGWQGAVLAGSAALASAFTTYCFGRWLGGPMLRRLIGPRINRVRQNLDNKSVVAVVTLRLLPIAPFSIVNLVCGTIRLGLRDYLIGTAMGLVPGLIVISAVGNQLVRLITHPTLEQGLLFGGFVLLWTLVTLGLQRLFSRARRTA
ncbi:VTT domain-containing protein [Radicibacter daui]|uniref:VTT domain-containing protein n=1 Tax=Radicibacter daui TaxID=3064829 RepID=UPI004046D534